MNYLKTMWVSSLVLAGTLAASFAQAGLGDGDLLSILRRTDVQGDMAIAPNQLSQINNFLSQLDQKVSEILNKARPDVKVGGFSIGKAPDPFNMADKIQNEFRGSILKLLDPAQVARAQQLGIQMEGNFAALMPDVAKQIKLDKDQAKQFNSFKKSTTDLKRKLEGQARKGEITKEDLAAQLLANDTTVQAELAKILKEDQRGLLEQLAGKKLGG